MDSFWPVRGGLALIGILLAGFVRAAPDTRTQQPASTQPFPPADARRPPGGVDAPEVVALLRERRDLLKSELDLVRKYLADPNLRVDMWSALAERLLVAETDVARTPAERIAAYRSFRDNLKLMEDQLKNVPEPRRDQGIFEYGQKLWIHGRRLLAEVSLLRAELTKVESSVAAEDPPAVRDALVAWRDAIRQWAKMWLDSHLVLIPAFAKEIAATALEAELAAAVNQTEQLAAYRAYRDRLLIVEKDTKAEVDRRRFDPYLYLRIKELRCEADMVLGRLKADGAPDDKELREVLSDWVEAIGFEMDALRKRYGSGRIPPGESLTVDESYLHEELTAAKTPAERIAAYQKFLGKLRDAEAALKPHAGDSPADRIDANRVAFRRAATELSLLELKAGAAAKASPQKLALLQEQHDYLRDELNLRLADWAAGRGDFQSLQENAGNLLLAELEIASAPADRLAAFAAHARRMRTVEDQCKTLIAEKKGNEAWPLWTREARLEADIWLLRAKAKLSTSSKP